ncbi:hypothetical protein [Hydrogenophaga sp.]|jgi:hypothetical protein|uniref:hypothetical protein n=1 Tax=Hydrogenophaga sp. TaxID=1904254 RepID=UPI003F7060EC
MIGRSTPWTITWIEDEIRSITFSGEWTLEPKFYLHSPANPCRDGSNIPINNKHLKKLLVRFERAAKE